MEFQTGKIIYAEMGMLQSEEKYIKELEARNSGHKFYIHTTSEIDSAKSMNPVDKVQVIVLVTMEGECVLAEDGKTQVEFPTRYYVITTSEDTKKEKYVGKYLKVILASKMLNISIDGKDVQAYYIARILKVNSVAEITAIKETKSAVDEGNLPDSPKVKINNVVPKLDLSLCDFEEATNLPKKSPMKKLFMSQKFPSMPELLTHRKKRQRSNSSPKKHASGSGESSASNSSCNSLDSSQDLPRGVSN